MRRFILEVGPLAAVVSQPNRFSQFMALLSLIAICLAGVSTPAFAQFLGPGVFSGTPKPRSSDATNGAESTYSGYILFTNISRSIVEQVLPPGMQLATNSAASTLHPVIFMFGHQRNTKWLIGGISYPVFDQYEEMILIVPFVQQAGQTNWHNYVVRMYLNDLTWFAIGVGNSVYAYAKEFGTFDELGLGVTVFSDLLYTSTPFFVAGMQVGAWQTSAEAESALPNYKAIQAIFEMPVLGYDDSIFGPRLVCSYFEFHYDTAMVAPLQSQHRFLQSFRGNMAPWVGLGLLSSVPDGAIAIAGLDWRLQNPPAACQF
jgi:hypothetical protein